MDEDNYSDSYMLDRLCWQLAVSAEGAYPPGKQADAIFEGRDVMKGDDEYQKAYNQFVEKFLIACDMFEHMEAHGFEPRERVEEFVEDTERGNIDWTWLENEKYEEP